MAHPGTARQRWNHPSHPHQLIQADAQRVYAAYKAKWKCDVCGRVFDAHRAPLALFSSGGVEEPDHRHFHHCNSCDFDVCSVCFKGRLHTFHFHRMKKARAALVYPETDGQWRCDACKAVHSEYTEQLCYHCQKCKVDMCERCYEGKWSHILHSNTDSDRGHMLKPVDPRIEYRLYQQWVCDNCQRTFSCEEESTAFHCEQCSFDLCETCFMGEKHHLHPHPLVLMEARDYTSTLYCSNCELSIREKTHYRCRRPSCHYFLCLRCYSSSPQLHPFHPHPLHVCDPVVVYPQSGGMWHCDQCTASSLNRQPVPLGPTETMYHCNTCEYDLCHSCYSSGFRRQTSVQEEEFRPLQVTQETHTDTKIGSEYSSYSYQPYAPTTYFTSDMQSRINRPLVTGMQPPISFLPPSFIPPHRLCQTCHTSEATTTFLHNGIPHSGYLCCNSCAADILSCRKPCPACRIPPDGVLNLPPLR